MDEIRERSGVADKMLYHRLIALADEVVQECAGIEFTQEFDVLFRKIAVRQDDIDIIAQRRKIEIVKIVAQRMRPCLKERLRIESTAFLKHACEDIEELRVIERTHS